jgi:hypothetical protein
MRWKLKTKADCKEGTERVLKKYALIPEILSDNYFVWLETFYVKQRYYTIGNKGQWFDQESWSKSTEKNQLLESIKHSGNTQAQKRLREKWRYKTQCNSCGYQSMDIYPEQNLMCPTLHCEGSMIDIKTITHTNFRKDTNNV